MKRVLAATLLLGIALPSPASAEIFRCRSPDGAVSYQQLPCEEGSVGGASPIATDYPPVNTAERDRLFEREAAMYKRLEARRDRELQEAAIRAASAPAAAPAPSEPVYVPVWFVPRRAHPFAPRPHPYQSIAR